MKNFVSIFIAFFYLITTSGVSVNFHYCQGKISSIKIFADSGSCCCAMEGKDMEGCCDDESFFYQIDDVQISSQISFEERFDNEFILPDFTQRNNNSSELIDEVYSSLFTHPPPIQTPRYILYSSLTFYG